MILMDETRMFWPGFGVICLQTPSEPYEMCMLGVSFPKKESDVIKEVEEKECWAGPAGSVGDSIPVHMRMYSITELHETIRMLYRKGSDVS